MGRSCTSGGHLLSFMIDLVFGNFAKGLSNHFRRILKGGQIVFGSLSVDCIVRDISATGARIQARGPFWFPDSFVLAIASDGTSRPCHIVWRKDGQIGVAFYA
ncbi:PilZ domain-containing protein [Bradyrhizobium yuanmingense]|uniref:PilZ domain-containing protein n=2 Tax=Bradyrhizobium TaxID=374 RepID=UPI003B969706